MMANSLEMIKLNEGIYSVCGTWLKHSSLLATRSYVIKNKNTSGILVIDTCGPGSGSIIFNAVKNYGLNPADIKGIAITHWHGDHTGGLAELVSLVAGSGGGPVKVFMHESDAGIFLQQKGRFLRIHPLIKLPVYHKPGKIPHGEQIVFVKLSSDLKENPLDEWGVEFIHTPGHTPGHTSYLHIPSKTLFAGSGLSLFKNNTLGIVPIFYDRTAQVESAKKLQKVNFRYLYPAHMQLMRGEIIHEELIPFNGRIPFLFRLAGTLPLFRRAMRENNK